MDAIEPHGSPRSKPNAKYRRSVARAPQEAAGRGQSQSAGENGAGRPSLESTASAGQPRQPENRPFAGSPDPMSA